jgi:predicted nucleotidyltransferase
VETGNKKSNIVKNLSGALTVEEISERTREVFRKHGIKRAILFGSLATGRFNRKSDLDLILVKETRARYFDRFEGILSDLYAIIPGKDIDLFIYTPEELAAISGRKFIQKAVTEGKIIYESR